MSYEYDRYLEKHKTNVANAYNWIRENLPELLKDNYEHHICFTHDHSKNEQDEYES